MCSGGVLLFVGVALGVAAGILPDPIIDAGHLMPGCRLVFFRDPEGRIIELMEGYSDEVES